MARRHQIVRHRTRVKNETHAILAAHLVPPCPHAELFNGPGRAWLARQVLPGDERSAIERHLRELDRLGDDVDVLDRDIGAAVVDNPAVRRLLTIAGLNITVAAGLVAAIGDIHRFSSPQKLVSYFGLNPRVRQSGLGFAQHGSARSAARTPGRFWSRPPGRRPRRRVLCTPSSCVSAPGAAIRSRPSRPHARSRSSSSTFWQRTPNIFGRARRSSPTSCARSSCRQAGP